MFSPAKQKTAPTSLATVGLSLTAPSQLVATRLLPDCTQSSSCICSARMNAWLLFSPDCQAISIGGLHLLQMFWSAHEAPLVALAIDRRET